MDRYKRKFNESRVNHVGQQIYDTLIELESLSEEEFNELIKIYKSHSNVKHFIVEQIKELYEALK